MKLLYVTPKGWESQRRPGCSLCGEEIEPSWLSPFTAMKIAKAAERCGATVVQAQRLSDAMAAVSARKLAPTPFKVVMRVPSNSTVPKGVPSDLRMGIDGWIFPTRRLLELYPDELKRAVVISEWAAEIPAISAPAASPGASIWVGPIDGNAERLMHAIAAVDAADGARKLAVYGTGKAGNVMPAVRRSRDINSRLGEAIVWLGDQSSLPEAIAKAVCVVQSGLDPTPLEIALVKAGLQLITPDFTPLEAPPSASEEEYIAYYNAL